MVINLYKGASDVYFDMVLSKYPSLSLTLQYDLMVEI